MIREKIETVLGKTFADKIDETVFTLGSKEYSRREMIEEVGCANFIAAAKLSAVLKRLNIKTVNQLYKMDPYSLARTKGIGETSIYVAMCILDANKLSPIEWWDFHNNIVKFSTFKHHAMRRASKRKQIA